MTGQCDVRTKDRTRTSHRGWAFAAVGMRLCTRVCMRLLLFECFSVVSVQVCLCICWFDESQDLFLRSIFASFVVLVSFRCHCLKSYVSFTDSVAKWLRRPSESERSRVRIPLSTGFFRVESYHYQLLKKLALQWLPCQAPGIIGLALGLVGLVSAYCDWVSRKFDLQLLSQCGSAYNCLSRSVPEVH